MIEEPKPGEPRPLAPVESLLESGRVLALNFPVDPERTWREYHAPNDGAPAAAETSTDGVRPGITSSRSPDVRGDDIQTRRARRQQSTAKDIVGA
jgi:hypothetical protein